MAAFTRYSPTLWAYDNGASLPYGDNLVVINDATLHGTHTWENMGLPYLILQTIVGPDSVLTIESGVQVLAQPGNLQLEGVSQWPDRGR